ncbi:MAG: hypothetical protein FWE31_04130 [Firmicutes bacterium]|nr:hypothetical protein [Bacillota bacterium]
MSKWRKEDFRFLGAMVIVCFLVIGLTTGIVLATIDRGSTPPNIDPDDPPTANAPIVGRWQPSGGTIRENGILVHTYTAAGARGIFGNIIEFRQDGIVILSHPTEGVLQNRWRVESNSLAFYQLPQIPGHPPGVMADTLTITGTQMTWLIEYESNGDMLRTEFRFTRLT